MHFARKNDDIFPIFQQNMHFFCQIQHKSLQFFLYKNTWLGSKMLFPQQLLFHIHCDLFFRGSQILELAVRIVQNLNSNAWTGHLQSVSNA